MILGKNHGSTTLHLHKQNFKFSAGHFLIFDEKHAERLHGHNYIVKIDFGFGEKDQGPLGFMVDFNVLKKQIHARLMEWDERVLLPKLHPDMKIKVNGTTLEVKFRDRFYAFPVNEVTLLEVTNTSVEQLSRILAVEFLEKFEPLGVCWIRVYVEESAGQGASHDVGLSPFTPRADT